MMSYERLEVYQLAMQFLASINPDGPTDSTRHTTADAHGAESRCLCRRRT